MPAHQPTTLVEAPDIMRALEGRRWPRSTGSSSSTWPMSDRRRHTASRPRLRLPRRAGTARRPRPRGSPHPAALHQEPGAKQPVRLGLRWIARRRTLGGPTTASFAATPTDESGIDTPPSARPQPCSSWASSLPTATTGVPTERLSAQVLKVGKVEPGRVDPGKAEQVRSRLLHQSCGTPGRES